MRPSAWGVVDGEDVTSGVGMWRGGFGFREKPWVEGWGCTCGVVLEERERVERERK